MSYNTEVDRYQRQLNSEYQRLMAERNRSSRDARTDKLQRIGQQSAQNPLTYVIDNGNDALRNYRQPVLTEEEYLPYLQRHGRMPKSTPPPTNLTEQQVHDLLFKQTNTKPNKLFVSRSCKHSQALVHLLKQHIDVWNTIELIEVVPGGRYPPQVQGTPCILAGNAAYNGGEAAKWVLQQSVNQLSTFQEADAASDYILLEDRAQNSLRLEQLHNANRAIDVGMSKPLGKDELKARVSQYEQSRPEVRRDTTPTRNVSGQRTLSASRNASGQRTLSAPRAVSAPRMRTPVQRNKTPAQRGSFY